MPFNIEEYLNSLPLNTTKIDVSDKGLTYLPDLSRFKQLTHLYCSYNYLRELPPLNNNLILLYCSRNQLRELPPLNDNLILLYCSRNQLRKLPPLNDNLKQLDCDNNELTKLPPLNDDLNALECYKNKLTELPHLNDNLEYLDCHHNQLTWLPLLNNKLKHLDCADNNIFNTNIYLYENKISILRNFRYTYYCLKFKNHFKRWLWEKVREPKIMAKFHPSHLDALEDSDDLEVFLEDWINK
jgi:Leucine-rich repeat (LRR) protein